MRKTHEFYCMTADRPTRTPLNAVRAFECAARVLSYTRAAEELGVTQGAVSRQIATLEAYIGQPLFRRVGRKIMREVPDIVQQCRGDDLLRRARLLGQLRTLQHVLGDAHRFAQVFLGTAPGEDLAQERDDGVVCQLRHRLALTASPRSPPPGTAHHRRHPGVSAGRRGRCSDPALPRRSRGTRSA